MLVVAAELCSDFVCEHRGRCLAARGSHQIRRNLVQLCHADSRGFADIGICVLESSSEGLAQVLADLLYSDASHGAHRKRTDHRIRVATILHKTVYGHDGEVGLGLGVVDQVQVDELPHLDWER